MGKEVLPVHADRQKGELTLHRCLCCIWRFSLLSTFSAQTSYTRFSFKNIQNFFHDLVPHKHMYLISNLNLFGFSFQSRGMTIVSLINCWYLQMVTNLTLILHNSDDVTRPTYEAKANILKSFLPPHHYSCQAN